MRHLRLYWAVSLLVFLLQGCHAPDVGKEIVQQREKEAESALENASAQGTKTHSGMISIHEGIWIGSRSIVKPNGEMLPITAESASAIILNSMGASLELKEIAAEITAQTGIKVVLEEHLDGASLVAAAESAKRASNDIPPPTPVMPPTHQQSGMTLSWRGSLSGLLDSISSYFGLQWEYRGGQIRIYKHEIRTFTLAALPSSSTIRSGVSTTGPNSSSNANAGNAGGGSTSSGSMMQDTASEMSIKLWDDIKETVQAMLPSGSKVTMSPATGTMTVIAPPLAMRRIANYVEQQNTRITRQVTISVKVLRVDLSDSYDLGLDLSGVFQQLVGQYAVNLTGPQPLKVTAGTPASYLVQAIQNTTSNKGNWATTTSTTHAVVDALQTMGKVSLMTETSVTTLNGQAAPVSVAEHQNFVASTATTLTGGASATTQTQVTPATLVTGFNMQILPRILDDGQIILQYGLSLSDLKSLTEFDSNGTKVQLPDVNIRSFLQQAILRSGDLLILAGYQSSTDSVADTGLPGIGPLLFGGSVQSAKSKSVIVIMMTPIILARRSEDAL
jgi:type IVB pilus formation R64 PilN family outer membrane protein